jgi:hypothetical protein
MTVEKSSKVSEVSNTEVTKLVTRKKIKIEKTDMVLSRLSLR